MRKPSILTYAACAAMLATLASCSSTNDEPDAPRTPVPQIIVLYGPGGLGDQGYNDRILTGVQSFKTAHHNDVEMYQYSPNSIDEAERLLSDWLSLPESNIPALFIAGSNDYEDLVAQALESQSLTKNKSLLLFESDNPKKLPITTFRMSMYGASYLAGVTAAATNNSDNKHGALIILAHPGDNTIARAGDGFSDGFSDAGATEPARTEYLADDWTGYVSAQIAYRNMSQWSRNYSFIFPVAGGSNQGIYRYTRENTDAPLTAGMDIDQSGLSRNITGSVVKHIDRVVFNYMETWLLTGQLPPSQVFGLESGYTDWVLSPHHIKYSDVVLKARPKAIRKEESQL